HYVCELGRRSVPRGADGRGGNFSQADYMVTVSPAFFRWALGQLVGTIRVGASSRAGGPPLPSSERRFAMTRLLPLTAALWVLGAVAPAAPPGKFTFVGLKPYANQKLTDNFGSGRDGNDLKALGKDGRTFADVNFKLGEGVIQLGSRLLTAEK